MMTSTIPTFIDFWNTNNNNKLEDYGFDINNPNHFSFIGRRDDDSIHSVFILLPYLKDIHVAHICSIYKSKALFRFITNTMSLAQQIESIRFVVCQDQGKPEFKISTKLAKAFGFIPIKTKFGWTDYIWDTKS